MFTILQNNTLSRAELSDSGCGYTVHYGDVLIKYGETLNATSEQLPCISSESVLSKFKASFLQDGDIIIADTAEDETVGKGTEICEIQGKSIVSGIHTIPCRPQCKFASAYLGYYMNSGAYHDQLLPLMQGTKVTSVSKSALQGTSLKAPDSTDEQERISRCFSALDNLITLHQRKLDKLHNVKKSLLEKMFPKNGADKPEIRFKGFTHAWEQRTVGVFYDFKNGLNKGKAFFGHGTPIVNFTDVFHNRSLYCKDLCGRVSLSREEINNFNVHKGDLFFTRTSETIEEIGYSSVMMDEPESTVFSGFVLRGRAVDDDPLENIFKSYVFFTDTFRKEMIMKSSMTTRALTSGTAIKKMLFYYPSDKTEQKRIGSLLEHLDHLITLHQRKLEKLQQIKKSLLEKMFV